ncbi:MAG: hypothetical protein WCJ81_08000 [bacterium]
MNNRLKSFDHHWSRVKISFKCSAVGMCDVMMAAIPAIHATYHKNIHHARYNPITLSFEVFAPDRLMVASAKAIEHIVVIHHAVKMTWRILSKLLPVTSLSIGIALTLLSANKVIPYTPIPLIHFAGMIIVSCHPTIPAHITMTIVTRRRMTITLFREFTIVNDRHTLHPISAV